MNSGYQMGEFVTDKDGRQFLEFRNAANYDLTPPVTIPSEPGWWLVINDDRHYRIVAWTTSARGTGCIAPNARNFTGTVETWQYLYDPDRRAEVW